MSFHIYYINSSVYTQYTKKASRVNLLQCIAFSFNFAAYLAQNVFVFYTDSTSAQFDQNFHFMKRNRRRVFGLISDHLFSRTSDNTSLKFYGLVSIYPLRGRERRILVGSRLSLHPPIRLRSILIIYHRQ